jgi:hypothetical protein
LAVSASETAVSTTVLAERDQHEAGFLPAIFQGFDTRPERLELLSFELRLAETPYPSDRAGAENLGARLGLEICRFGFPSRCAFVNSS